MMRYQALFVSCFLEVYAFEYYKSDQIVVFDVAYCDCADSSASVQFLISGDLSLGHGQNSSNIHLLVCG